MRPKRDRQRVARHRNVSRMLSADKHARAFAPPPAEVAAVTELLAKFDSFSVDTESLARAVLVAAAHARDTGCKPSHAADAAFNVYCHAR